MRDEIINRFNDNLNRVRSLMAVYSSVRGQGRGRSSVHTTDVLRAATVFLHATLEEFCRGIAAWKYPLSAEATLNDIPLVGLSDTGRPEKFFLGKLANHRSKSVQEVIDESIKAYLDNFTVNNTTDLSSFLRKIGVVIENVNGEYSNLSELINRRHHIVHQADRKITRGRGNHRAQAINSYMVQLWIDSVQNFINAIMNELAD